MITLTDACGKVLAMHPKEYIHVVNEYENVYQFILADKGYKVTDRTFNFWTPAVNKKTGELIDNAGFDDEIFTGSYKQYSRSEIESA